jgi:hypothetical protein
MRSALVLVILVLTVIGAKAQTLYSFQGADDGASPAYKFKTLYRFTGGTDGGGPLARLIADGTGNLYGTTVSPSTVFKLGSGGKETVLHSFHGSHDGFEPIAGLLRDEQGNLRNHL